MQKIMTALLAVTLMIGGCSKSNDCPFDESNVVAPASETAAVQAYLTANSITATAHPSGMFYSITTDGNGATAELCSAISLRYNGRLVNGTVFDPGPALGASPAQFRLGELIVGWQKGIPLIKPGGKIKLYIPPSLGYGSRAVTDRSNPSVVVIPANSILIFEIDLLDVQ